jgi:hypothetical protein
MATRAPGFAKRDGLERNFIFILSLKIVDTICKPASIYSINSPTLKRGQRMINSLLTAARAPYWFILAFALVALFARVIA